MRKLSEYIEELKPAELAKLRKKRINDSSRDKQSLLKRIKDLETALSDRGNIVFFSDIQYLNYLAGAKQIKVGQYYISVFESRLLIFENSKTFDIPPVSTLVNKLIDKLKFDRIDPITFDFIPDDDIVEIIEKHLLTFKRLGAKTHLNT